MRILDVTTFFHARSGGIKRYLERKARFLSEKGIAHAIVVPGVESRTWRLFGANVYELRSFPLLKKSGYRVFSNPLDIRRILKIEKPDIVEIGGSFFITPFLGKTDAKVLVFYHSHLEEYLSFLPAGKLLRGALGKFLTVDLLKRANMVITPSRKVETILRSYGIKELVTIHLGVDPKIFFMDSKRRSKIFPPRILYSGRLSKDKGFDLLLKIIEALPEKSYTVFVAGDGPERERLISTCRERKNVRYLGYLKGEFSLARFYRKGDVLLGTSPFETFGLSFLEAQACGCLLVAKNLGLETQPVKEFLVENGDLESYLEAIKRASSSDNGDLRERVSNLMRTEFSWDKSFKKLMVTYTQLLST